MHHTNFAVRCVCHVFVPSPHTYSSHHTVPSKQWEISDLSCCKLPSRQENSQCAEFFRQQNNVCWYNTTICIYLLVSIMSICFVNITATCFLNNLPFSQCQYEWGKICIFRFSRHFVERNSFRAKLTHDNDCLLFWKSIRCFGWVAFVYSWST